MDGFLKIFEKFIVIVLILLMVMIIVVATFVTGSAIVRYIFSSPNYLIDDIELLDVLGYILLILIGIELLETVKAYLDDHIIHVEVVLEVALIAVARKVILLDYKEYSGLTVLAMAVLIIALSIGFYLEKRGRNFKNGPEDLK
jgi:uncharacterized membrane protein (DUF373 family)